MSMTSSSPLPCILLLMTVCGKGDFTRGINQLRSTLA